MINHNEWLIVGFITSPQGINGEMKVKSLSDFEERFTKPGKRWIQKENEIPKELELTNGFKKPGIGAAIVAPIVSVFPDEFVTALLEEKVSLKVTDNISPTFFALLSEENKPEELVL